VDFEPRDPLAPCELKSRHTLLHETQLLLMIDLHPTMLPLSYIVFQSLRHPHSSDSGYPVRLTRNVAARQRLIQQGEILWGPKRLSWHNTYYEALRHVPDRIPLDYGRSRALRPSEIWLISAPERHREIIRISIFLEMAL
jgi:hypothetical protein